MNSMRNDAYQCVPDLRDRLANHVIRENRDFHENPEVPWIP